MSALLSPPLPLLADAWGCELPASGWSAPESLGPWTVSQHADWLVAAAVVPGLADPAQAAADLYAAAFDWPDGFRAVRYWNYVPQINAVAADGLENYRHFSVGRHRAFVARFGSEAEHRMPAASAVGHPGDTFTIQVLATRSPAMHFENPRQVPAYRYPTQYGPRPPAFARATRVDTPKGAMVILSGTAAVRDHHSIGGESLTAQLAETCLNIRVVLAEAGFDIAPLAPVRPRASWRVYVRNPRDLPATQVYLQDHLLRPQDQVVYLHADICRSELLVEIEGLFFQE